MQAEEFILDPGEEPATNLHSLSEPQPITQTVLASCHRCDATVLAISVLRCLQVQRPGILLKHVQEHCGDTCHQSKPLNRKNLATEPGAVSLCCALPQTLKN